MTKRQIPRFVASALALALLAACDGGGSGGSDYAAKLRGDAPTAALQMTPQPTAIPPPTALPVLTQPPAPTPTLQPTTPPPPINPEPVVIYVTATPVVQVFEMPNVEPYPANATGCAKDSAGIWVCPEDK